MLARALFLRKAIDQFVDDENEDNDLSIYKLTRKEWDQAGVIVTILLPFKLTSVRLQATKRPGIDMIFWEYESLFNNYETITIIEADNSRKHSHDDSFDEDEVGDYRAYLHQHSRSLTISQNEFDRYIDTSSPVKKIKTLEYWKDHISDFPHLKFMIHDTFAVPATGAGVEHMFSRSGRVATWGRARLNGITITEMMLYKEFLDRIGQPLDEQVERRRAERRKTKKKNPKPGAEEASDSEDDEEEEPALIAWELEWWKKEGAAIIH